jgi:hypothetical protein
MFPRVFFIPLKFVFFNRHDAKSKAEIHTKVLYTVPKILQQKVKHNLRPIYKNVRNEEHDVTRKSTCYT